MSIDELDIDSFTQENPDFYHGQMRYAHLLIDQFGYRLLYANGLGWHQWDGHRWVECKDGAPTRAVRAVFKEQLVRIIEMPTDDRKTAFVEVTKLETRGGVDGILGLAQDLPPFATSADAMDSNPLVLNTQSGLLDLATGEVTEPNPRVKVTKVTAAEFDPEAKSELWDSFLATVLPKEDVRQFVQRLFGYALLGEVREQVLPIFTGTGANGKSVLMSAVRDALGDYAIEVAPDMLLERRNDAHTTELTDLKGARVAFAAETDKTRKFAEATVKRLVDGTPIKARKMRENNITIIPSHTLIMATNKLPEVSGDDPAIWRRILVVPFDVVIPKEKRDVQLTQKLRAESAAVLAWCYQGWVDYQKQGLAAPEAVQARTDAYQSASDYVGRFLDEECVTGEHMRVLARPLFHQFDKWCRQTGETPVSEKVFAESVAGRLGVGTLEHVSKSTVGGSKVYRGLGLRELTDEEKFSSHDDTPWKTNGFAGARR